LVVIDEELEPLTDRVTVHLVRHGDVENPDKILYGRLPGFHLSERGRRQAEEAGDHLKSIAEIGTIHSSPMERTRETAEIIAERTGAAVVIDDRLIESRTKFEGVGKNIEAFIRAPRQWLRFRNPFKPSWGESFSDIRRRMLEAVKDARAEARGRDVVMVSHQTPVLVARFGLARRNVPPWLGFTPCETGSVTTMVLDGDRVESVSYFAPLG
jgi:broad specificity phosphatase PhoE